MMLMLILIGIAIVGFFLIPEKEPSILVSNLAAEVALKMEEQLDPDAYVSDRYMGDLIPVSPSSTYLIVWKPVAEIYTAALLREVIEKGHISIPYQANDNTKQLAIKAGLDTDEADVAMATTITTLADVFKRKRSLWKDGHEYWLHYDGQTLSTLKEHL